MTRLLHDTCINTLGAIRSGIGTKNSEAVRDRCAYDLQQMDRLAQDFGAATLPRLSELAATAERDGRLLGVSVHAELVADDRYPLNPVVWQAASGAVREALVNVAKHTGRDHADVRVMTSDTSVVVEVRDQGVGWSGTVPEGGGIDRSIRERVMQSGGLALVTSDPGRGTRVTMTWPKAVAMAPPPDKAGREFAPARGATPVEDSALVELGMRRIILGSGGWMLGYCFAATLIFLDDVPSTGSVLALVVMALWLWFAAQRTQMAITGWLTVLLAVGLAIVVALPAHGEVGCPSVSPAAWGADGATVLVLIMCLLSASWWNPVAALLGFAVGLAYQFASGFAVGDACASSTAAVFVIEAGTVIVIFAFRHLLVRTWARADDDRRAALEVEAVAVESAARERAREARLRSALSGAGPLMMRIAEGESDPADPAVMDEAGEKEAALRSLLVLDSALGPLGDALAGALIDGMDTGRRIEIRSGEFVPPPEARQIELIREVIDAAIAATPRGSVVPVALFARPDGGVITLVTAVSSPLLSADDVDRLAAHGLTASQLELEDEVLVEVQWTTT